MAINVVHMYWRSDDYEGDRWMCICPERLSPSKAESFNRIVAVLELIGERRDGGFIACFPSECDADGVSEAELDEILGIEFKDYAGAAPADNEACIVTHKFVILE